MTVLAVSGPYRDRPPSRLVRVYLDTTPTPPTDGRFTVSCPACPELDHPAGSEAAATDLAGGHDDTHHHGAVTAVVATPPGRAPGTTTRATVR
jgi:hypothetical protein